MGLLPGTQNYGSPMHRKYRERFPRHRQRKPLVSHHGMHHGTCVTHVMWCMSGSPTRGGEKKIARHPWRMPKRKFAYLVRGPFLGDGSDYTSFRQLMVVRSLWILMQAMNSEDTNIFPNTWGGGSGPNFYIFFGVSSGCARPITEQFTSVIWPMIDWA